MSEGAAATGRAPLGRQILIYLITLTTAFICIEIASFVAITLIKRSGVFYNSAMVTQNYYEFLEKRDLNLGWGPSRSGGPIKINAENTAGDGTRHDPVFPIDARSCLSLFGNSFTWSEGVADKDAWGSILAAKLKCRVANFGVGGYGTDKAFPPVSLASSRGWGGVSQSPLSRHSTQCQPVSGTYLIRGTNPHSNLASSSGMAMSNWYQPLRSRRRIFRGF